MNKILYVFAFVIMFGCSNEYIEYNINNDSSENIFVEITPNSSSYNDTLFFLIEPNQKLNVFEYKKQKDDSVYLNPCKPFKSFKVSQNMLEFSIVDSCNYVNKSEQKGLLGKYIIYEFIVNDSSFVQVGRGF